MPELPEVHTISSDLDKTIRNHVIKNVLITGTYKVFPSREDFIKHTAGQKIKSVSRIAKNIKIDLESGKSILIHLAMTGQVLLRPHEHKPDLFLRVLFTLENADKSLQMRFCDMRMFGKVVLADSDAVSKLKLKYGPEPINRQVNVEEFYAKLRSRRTSIKNALLDQELVSGLGNIYATDTLFMSGVHPETNTKDLSIIQAEKLLNNARQILEEGIEHRGSTLGDKMYVDAFGREGTHQNFFRIYNKEICPTCQTPVEFKKINGRGTYFCPKCQTFEDTPRLL